MLTINGRICLRRIRWHCPEEGSEAPLSLVIDVAESALSVGVREMACRLNQGMSSFQKSSDNLWRTAHIKVSKETIRHLVEGEGLVVLRAMQQAQLIPDWSSADCTTENRVTRIYLGCDGVKVPLITDIEKKKRRKQVRLRRRRSGRKCKPLARANIGADNAYKEFKIGYLYDERKERRLVGVTSGNHEAAGRMLRRMSDQTRLDEADERIAIIDGAPWIRNQIELHGLTEDIGLDFWHLKDNAQKARRVVYGEESRAGGEWIEELMHTFKHDGYWAAWDLLSAWRKGLRGTRRKAADSLMKYVAERMAMIRYPEFRERDWQIGSGPTEAECKTITSRVKGRGRRWDSRGAEAMMALAALDDSGLWQNHWLTVNSQTN